VFCTVATAVSDTHVDERCDKAAVTPGGHDGENDDDDDDGDVDDDDDVDNNDDDGEGDFDNEVFKRRRLIVSQPLIQIFDFRLIVNIPVTRRSFRA
jgi:hypothetical protein